MSLRKSSQTLLIGANSDIGNQILLESQAGESLPRVFFGRSIPGKAFRDIDIFIEFDALKLAQAEADLNSILNDYDIRCIILSYCSMDYPTPDEAKISNYININSTIALAEIIVKYFHTRFRDTNDHGTIIYVSSSIIGLNPRQKNYKYTAAKLAVDYFFRGLRDQVQISGSKTKIIIIRPGFTHTKLHLEETGPFATTIEKLGRSVRRQLNLNLSTIYAPFLIQLPMFILSLLPSKALNRLDNMNE